MRVSLLSSDPQSDECRDPKVSIPLRWSSVTISAALVLEHALCVLRRRAADFDAESSPVPVQHFPFTTRVTIAAKPRNMLLMSKKGTFRFVGRACEKCAKVVGITSDADRSSQKHRSGWWAWDPTKNLVSAYRLAENIIGDIISAGPLPMKRK